MGIVKYINLTTNSQVFVNIWLDANIIVLFLVPLVTWWFCTNHWTMVTMFDNILGRNKVNIELETPRTLGGDNL